MRSANPQSFSQAAADNRSYEPSMEEILASIRRIIADDQAAPANGAASFPSVSHSPGGDFEPDGAAAGRDAAEAGASAKAVLEAAGPKIAEPERVAPSPAETGVAQVGPAHDVPEPESMEADAPSHDEPVPHEDTVHEEAPATESLYEDESSFSVYDLPVEAADAKPDDAIKPADVMASASDPFEEAVPLLSGSTDSAVASAFNMLAASRLADHSDEIMALARDMIRPLLRSWIDDNLPGMVERMVRAEIERVARGGR